jgi:hypothetical protein
MLPIHQFEHPAHRVLDADGHGDHPGGGEARIGVELGVEGGVGAGIRQEVGAPLAVDVPGDAVSRLKGLSHQLLGRRAEGRDEDQARCLRRQSAFPGTVHQHRTGLGGYERPRLVQDLREEGPRIRPREAEGTQAPPVQMVLETGCREGRHAMMGFRW